ncbi:MULTISPECIES: DeoR/GlpR family DNA-binding transcription regulator [Anaerotruncus]|uniref:DeoR/GlpR family DNA-binding transcription regulator n=1 Tax=Anaerotruncus TaxID=244127 RepID=UPI0008376099|nr:MULTISPECIES: DeoR/GlpR family DNA-binding transcription regulator [Anaerotruncus]
MLTIERQEQIKNILLEQKSVSVADLTARFDVSFETIRRDLKVLEKEGFVEKSYGGAILKQRVNNTADFQMLSNIMVEAKQRMAAMALNFISPGDCIYIGFATTCVQIAELLDNIPITVLTSSLEVMNKLSGKKNITLFSTGGAWDARNCAFTGRTAVDNLAQFHLDKAFISCRALSMENGISDKTEAESDMRRRIVESSNEVYLLADNSKFGKMTFVKTCGFERITAVITDKTLSKPWASFLDDLKIAHYDCEHPLESAEDPEK